MRRPPRELTSGLTPIRIGLLRSDYAEALQKAMAAREGELSRRLDVLRVWYGVEPGPDCWRNLCLAMAAERFSGFRERAGRKPQKWTPGVLTMLAGEMRRVMDSGAGTQQLAAQCLAGTEQWQGFLSRGQHRKNRRRERWENLFNQHTRMPARYRKVGEEAYLGHKEQGTLAKWDAIVRDFLGRPA